MAATGPSVQSIPSGKKRPCISGQASHANQPLPATTPARIAELLAETGSLIATIERLRGPGRSLRPYQVPDLPDFEKWLADNEVLDAEGPDEMFEPFSGKGLWRGRLGRGRLGR